MGMGMFLKSSFKNQQVYVVRLSILFPYLKIIEMQGSKQDIEIEEDITYSLTTDSFNKPLRLTNKSSHIYVFKIKTNQRSVISMQVTHDFIKPNSVKEIIIRLADKPSESTPLRLELNYAIPTEEQIRINDSKMNSYGRDAVFRKVVTINRDDSAKPQSLSASITRKEENVFPDQASVNLSLSTTSIKQERKEEKHEQKEIQKEVKQTKKDEKQLIKQEKKEQKVEQLLTASVFPIKYPDLSYIRQVQSEQIEIVTGKSTEINVTDLVAEAPSSSEQALNAYSKPIDIAKQAAQEAKKQEKPIVKIPSIQKEDSFSYATSSPLKKTSSPEKKLHSEEERLLSEINEKLEKEQATITRLKNEQTAALRSGCIYPIPILYLLVLMAFFSGALVNWILI